MTGWGPLSFLEGIRLVLDIGCIGAISWALTHARDGVMAFARPIRERMVFRRRVQQIANLLIVLIWGAQTISAAQVPDPAVITTAGLAVSYAVIATLTIILIKTLMFSIGWAGVQEVVGNTPLDPDAEERAAEATAAGRDLAHIASNHLAVTDATLRLLLDDESLSPESRTIIEGALGGSDAIIAYVESLQGQIRELSETADAVRDRETGARP